MGFPGLSRRKEKWVEKLKSWLLSTRVSVIRKEEREAEEKGRRLAQGPHIYGEKSWDILVIRAYSTGNFVINRMCI